MTRAGPRSPIYALFAVVPVAAYGLARMLYGVALWLLGPLQARPRHD